MTTRVDEVRDANDKFNLARNAIWVIGIIIVVAYKIWSLEAAVARHEEQLAVIKADLKERMTETSTRLASIEEKQMQLLVAVTKLSK